MKYNTLNYFIQNHLFNNSVNFKNLNHVIIDNKNRLIFNRIPKNANTYVCNIIFSELGHVSIRDGKSTKKHGPNFRNTLLLKDIKNFKRLLVIRDPATRVLSAFLDKFRKQKYRREYGEFSLDLAGFATFLDWLADEGLPRNRHWDLQKNVIAFNLNFFTDIIRMEEMDSLHTYLRRLGYPIEHLSINKIYDKSNRHKTGSSKQHYILQDVYIYQKIREIYAEDYEYLKNYYE